MRCATIKKFGPQGNPLIGQKIRYKTLADAQVEVDRQNALPMVYIKREAYKCKKCKQYHVGKSYEMIEGKVAKPKIDKFRSLNLKIVGKIDLGTVPDKKWNPILKEQEKEKKARYVAPIKGLSQSNGREPYGNIPLSDGLWLYHFKKKILLITKPDGTTRRPKLNKIYEERALRLYANGHQLSKRVARLYIRKNFNKL